jgi:hypothetical protein
MRMPDTRCGDQLLLDTRRSAAATSDLTTPRPSPCARNPEIHRGYRRRRLPVFEDKIIEHYKQQPHGRCSSPARRSSAGWSARRQGQRIQGERLQPRYSATRIRRWRPGWKSRTHRADYGGPGHGRGRVRCQHQARGVLPLEEFTERITRPRVFNRFASGSSMEDQATWYEGVTSQYMHCRS